jgi:hypothetical protein
MSNEIIENKSPDYLMYRERTRKQINLGEEPLPVDLLITQLVQVATFVDRVGEAIAVSGADIVKVDAAGTITAISAGDDLNGYWIGYQSAAGDAKGDTISGWLEYWSAI